MLFPEEIFDLILKQHKLNYLEKVLNDVINHRIKKQFCIYNFYSFTIKRLVIQVHKETEFHQLYTTYFWKNKLYMDWLI